jgi:hypothetical protein
MKKSVIGRDLGFAPPKVRRPTADHLHIVLTAMDDFARMNGRRSMA